MLQHICSYINSVLSTRKNDEQNAFEQNVVANLVNELLHNIRLIRYALVATKTYRVNKHFYKF